MRTILEKVSARSTVSDASAASDSRAVTALTAGTNATYRKTGVHPRLAEGIAFPRSAIENSIPYPQAVITPEPSQGSSHPGLRQPRRERACFDAE